MPVTPAIGVPPVLARPRVSELHLEKESCATCVPAPTVTMKVRVGLAGLSELEKVDVCALGDGEGDGEAEGDGDGDGDGEGDADGDEDGDGEDAGVLDPTADV